MVVIDRHRQIEWAIVCSFVRLVQTQRSCLLLVSLSFYIVGKKKRSWGNPRAAYNTIPRDAGEGKEGNAPAVLNIILRLVPCFFSGIPSYLPYELS